MKFGRGISTKLLVTFLLIGLVPIIVFGYISVTSSKRNIKNQIYDKVLATAEAKEGQIYLYLDAIKRRTENFASDGLIKIILKENINSEEQKTELPALSEYLGTNTGLLDENIVVFL